MSGHHHKRIRAMLPKQADDGERFKGGDAASDGENRFFSL
jgi:hypothetical protein